MQRAQRAICTATGEERDARAKVEKTARKIAEQQKFLDQLKVQLEAEEKVVLEKATANEKALQLLNEARYAYKKQTEEAAAAKDTPMDLDSSGVPCGASELEGGKRRKTAPCMSDEETRIWDDFRGLLPKLVEQQQSGQDSGAECSHFASLLLQQLTKHAQLQKDRVAAKSSHVVGGAGNNAGVAGEPMVSSAPVVASGS